VGDLFSSDDHMSLVIEPAVSSWLTAIHIRRFCVLSELYFCQTDFGLLHYKAYRTVSLYSMNITDLSTLSIKRQKHNLFILAAEKIV
jgi:hypothetical protein